MIDKRITNSITEFLLNGSMNNKSNYVIYNGWAQRNNFSVKNEQDVLALIDFIDNFKNTNPQLIKAAYAVDTL